MDGEMVGAPTQHSKRDGLASQTNKKLFLEMCVISDGSKPIPEILNSMSGFSFQNWHCWFWGQFQVYHIPSFGIGWGSPKQIVYRRPRENLLDILFVCMCFSSLLCQLLSTSCKNSLLNHVHAQEWSSCTSICLRTWIPWNLLLHISSGPFNFPSGGNHYYLNLSQKTMLYTKSQSVINPSMSWGKISSIWSL